MAVIKKVDGHQTRLWYTLGLTWRTEYELSEVLGDGASKKDSRDKELDGARIYLVDITLKTVSMLL